MMADKTHIIFQEVKLFSIVYQFSIQIQVSFCLTQILESPMGMPTSLSPFPDDNGKPIRLNTKQESIVCWISYRPNGPFHINYKQLNNSDKLYLSFRPLHEQRNYYLYTQVYRYIGLL